MQDTADQMYKIEFYFRSPAPHHSALGYGSYVKDGEKFVNFDEEHPRLYTSKKRAMDAAEKLSAGYTNTSAQYRVVKVSPKTGPGKRNAKKAATGT